MKRKICIEASIAGELAEFLKAEGIELGVVTQGDCDVTVVRCEDHKESDLHTIYSHGWIGCGTALALAPRLEISTRQLGKLLNYLEVKIRYCSLGCFE